MIDYGDLAPSLLVEEDGPVRVLTLNEPDHLNSFSDPLHDAVRLVWDRLLDDEEANAVVLTGAGRAFSTGGHLPNFTRMHDDDAYRRRSLRNADRLVSALLACELPIVAAVNGPAIGLGASLAVMSDIVVMADDAYVADPHVSVGIVAGDGGAVAWPLVMGLLRAKEHLLLGDRIYAADCERLGLANHVVPLDAVLPTALELAHRLAAQPRQALRDTKRAVNLHLQHAAQLILPFALAAEEETFTSPEVRAKVEAFKAGQRTT